MTFAVKEVTKYQVVDGDGNVHYEGNDTESAQQVANDMNANAGNASGPSDMTGSTTADLADDGSGADDTA